jgi:hypothetical protein
MELPLLYFCDQIRAIEVVLRRLKHDTSAFENAGSAIRLTQG